MDLEAVLRRLDRLTHDEARMAAAQILEIVYRIVQNMGVLMDGELRAFIIDGKVSVDHLKNALGKFCGSQSSDCVSDWALEIMHELASEVNKSKRRLFLILPLLTGVANIVWQATRWSRIFDIGCHRLTLGRITIFPASHATEGPRGGSFRATRF